MPPELLKTSSPASLSTVTSKQDDYFAVMVHWESSAQWNQEENYEENHILPCSFSRAAVTEYHTLGCLRKRKCIIVLGAVNLKSRCCPGRTCVVPFFYLLESPGTHWPGRHIIPILCLHIIYPLCVSVSVFQLPPFMRTPVILDESHPHDLILTWLSQ